MPLNMFYHVHYIIVVVALSIPISPYHFTFLPVSITLAGLCRMLKEYVEV